MTVINVSELDPQWNWLARRFNSPHFTWAHHTLLNQAIRPAVLRGPMAAFKAVWQARWTKSPALLVAHGPRIGSYTCLAAMLLGCRAPILVYSFNYTHLPQGLQRKLARWMLPRAHHYVVFSTLEKSLYAQHLGLPAERFEMLPWGVQPPTRGQPSSLLGTTDPSPGLCALGSQGRDYATLFKAMRRLPHIRLTAVVNPDNIAGLDIPPNVTIRTGIPLEEAQRILRDSRFMVLPLAHAQVPCGHVTAVSAMHHGKAMVCTDSVGLHDYAQRDHTALLCPPGDDVHMAKAIERLWNDPALAQRLGDNGLRFAQTHCTEDAVVQWFDAYLRSLPAAFT